jgi:hypothetical protein
MFVVFINFLKIRNVFVIYCIILCKYSLSFLISLSQFCIIFLNRTPKLYKLPAYKTWIRLFE